MAMNFETMKQFMMTKMMLYDNHGSNGNSMFGPLFTMMLLSGISWLFSVLPGFVEIIKNYLIERYKKTDTYKNISTTITSKKEIKSKISFVRKYDAQATSSNGYEFTDSIIEYLTSIDDIKCLERDKIYMCKPEETIAVTEDIFCTFHPSKVEDTVSFTLYSETIPLSKLKQWIENVLRESELSKQNKLGVERYFFNENPVPVMSGKNLPFTMTKFKTNKSLDTIYGEDIKIIKNRVALFKNNIGWYKKNGIPHTLGILLHGLPGCGKTSIIKALGKDLDRHIFNLKMSAKTTEIQLWNLFYNDYVYILNDVGHLEKIFIPCHSRLYVLEDVDCLTDVFLDRRLVKEKKEKEILTDEEQKNKKKYQDAQDLKDTPITLSFLLNLIDGLLEVPGRVMIMTSNYPEKLDSALLRPGRIDINLKLSLCGESTFKEMFANFYSKDGNYSMHYDFSVIANYFTPANVQRYLSDHFDDPLKAYNKMVSVKENEHFLCMEETQNVQLVLRTSRDHPSPVERMEDNDLLELFKQRSEEIELKRLHEEEKRCIQVLSEEDIQRVLDSPHHNPDDLLESFKQRSEELESKHLHEEDSRKNQKRLFEFQIAKLQNSTKVLNQEEAEHLKTLQDLVAELNSENIKPCEKCGGIVTITTRLDDSTDLTECLYCRHGMIPPPISGRNHAEATQTLLKETIDVENMRQQAELTWFP